MIALAKRRRTILIGLVVLVIAVGLRTVFLPAWRYTGSLNFARSEADAVILKNGKVLILGGDDRATCEVYDPNSGKWSKTGTEALNGADSHIFLQSNGTVSVQWDHEVFGQSYDPETGAWIKTAPPVMGEYDLFDSGIYYKCDGKFLTQFNPTTQVLRKAKLPEFTTQVGYKLLPFPSGKIAVIINLAAQANPDLLTDIFDREQFTIFDPASQTFSPVYFLTDDSNYHSSTFIVTPRGKLVSVGGHNFRQTILFQHLLWTSNVYAPVSLVAIFSPETGTWTYGPPLQEPRNGAAAVVLRNGDILVMGGDKPTKTCELLPAEVLDNP